MSDFDGKKFYGFAMQNDPNLTTTTNNFEFRFLRSELLEKAIHKVHNKEDPKMKEKNMMWHNFCQKRETNIISEKKTGLLSEVSDSFQTNSNNSQNTKKERDLSDQEVDDLIDKAKLKADSLTSKSTLLSYSPNKGLTSKSPRTTDMCTTNVHHYIMSLRNISPVSEEALCLTKNIDEVYFEEPQQVIPDKEQMYDHNVLLEEYRLPQPKWVEIVEQSKESRLEIDIKEHCGKTSNPLKSTRPMSSYNANIYQRPIQEHFIPGGLLTEIITDNIRSDNDDYINKLQFDNNDGNGESSYIIEDSDEEFEELKVNRPQYLKYTQPGQKSDEMLNLSIEDDDNSRVAELIGKEMPNLDAQYLTNSYPLEFTDFSEDVSDNEKQINNEPQIYINGSKKQQFQNDHLTTSEVTKSSKRCASPQKEFNQKLKTEAKPTSRQQHIERTFERLAGGGCASPFTTLNESARSSTTAQSQKFSRMHSQCNFERLEGGGCVRPATPLNRSARSLTPVQLQRASRAHSKCPLPDQDFSTNRMPIKPKKTGSHSQRSNKFVYSKSIEDLKAEKTHIFNKMTATQEKMIEVLDKLRLNILEINAPANSFDKSRRQKNAFEFSVRFSRNFLYPLKGMREDLLLTSDELFNSLTSNEACKRVCYVYGLLLQSLNTYQKQLRFFLLDQVPQKLTTLIEMIYSITAICLEKNIFSKQDVIVDCLQERCSTFLGFLKDLQNGGLQSARQSYRKLNHDQAHSKYELNMVMNNLNMYEAKLVPKVVGTDRSAKTKKKKTKRPINQVIVDESPDTLLEKPQEDAITTQIQDTLDNKSSTCLIDSQVNMASGDSITMDKNNIEALQNLSKEQVGQVLKPILDSLGCALGNQNNSEVIEAICKAFNIQISNILEVEQQQNANSKYLNESEFKSIELSSVDSLGNTCKSLKAAKQTKTPHQENSHETLPSKKRSSTTTGIIVHDDDSDDYGNNNNKNDSNGNANSKSNNSKTNSTTYLSVAGDVGGGAGGGAADFTFRGERSSEANHMEETTTMTTVRTNENVSKKINNKSKKLMNEDQIGEEVRQAQASTIQQSGGEEQSNVTQEDDSTSDSEGGRNPKFNKHQKTNRKVHQTYLNKSKHCSKSHDSCFSLQRSTNSQCPIPPFSTRNSSKPILSYRNSLDCFPKTKKKHDPLQTPPPAPLVTTTSSENITDNQKYEDYRLDQLQTATHCGDNVKKPLLGNITAFMTEGALANESDDESENKCKEQRVNVDCDTNFKLCTGNITETVWGASYVELCNKSDLPLYNKKSSYNTPENSPPRRKLIERNPKHRQCSNKTTRMPPPKRMSTNSRLALNSNNEPLKFHNFGEQTNSIECNGEKEFKSDLCIDKMLKERNQFLELCNKNRFYKNPNFAEPWKVFSAISETLLNDVLSSVEHDFADVFSKFVDDFLELETKT